MGNDGAGDGQGAERWLLISVVTGPEGALRVRVWRELRKLGAVYLHSAVCLLPDRPAVADTVKALARRVRDGGGTARIVSIQLLEPADRESIIAEQTADRDGEYAEVIERTAEFLAEIERETIRHHATYTEVEESETDLDRFERWMVQIDARNYFDAPGRSAAVAAIQRCRDVLADFQAAALTADTGNDPVIPDTDTRPSTA